MKFNTDLKTSLRMRSVRTHGTSIELAARRLFHRLGYRFARSNHDLPGKPDIIFPKHKTVAFVHGCFWHGHDKCPKGLLRPRRNIEFWNGKIRYNKERDGRNKFLLKKLGWNVLVLWECELSHSSDMVGRIRRAFKKNE